MAVLSILILSLRSTGSEQPRPGTSILETTASLAQASSLILGIVLLIITSIFAHEPCENATITIIFLGLQGGNLLLLALVCSLAPYYCLLPLIAYLDFVLLIWGMNKIIGSIQVKVQCPTVPSITAYVFLIANCILFCLLFLAIVVSWIISGIIDLRNWYRQKRQIENV